MSTTWSARIRATHGHRPRLYFTIQGIPDVFQEDETDVPTVLEASARPRRKLVKLNGITQSPGKLDMAARKAEGGTLKLELQDDADGTLAALFAPRSYRSTYVRANKTAAASSVEVKSGAQIDAAGHVYVDSETIEYDAVGAGPTLTGCTRGAYGSTAAKHFGSSVNGASVFTAPPAWKGRRVYLRSYFLNDDGTTTLALSRAEGTFVIEKAPRYTGDVDGVACWEIQCAELSDELYKRKIGSGLREVELEEGAGIVTSATAGRFDLTVGADDNVNQFVRGTVQTHVILRNAIDSFLCFGLTDSDGVDTIEMGGQIVQNAEDGIEARKIKSARHVAILTGSAAQIARYVLSSKLGDGANGLNDVLPGRDRDEFGRGAWRMGAGILEAELDESAFNTVGSAVGSWSYVIDEEMTVADFLFEFCLHTNSVAFVTRAGLLSVCPLAEESNESTMTVDGSLLKETASASVEYDEEPIRPRLHMLCNYDPLTKQYCAEIDTFDAEMADRFTGSEDVLELASKTVVAATPFRQGRTRTRGGIQAIQRTTMTQGSLEGMLRTIQVSQGRGRGFVSGRWLLAVLDLERGDLVEISVTAPNLEGALTISQMARLVEIGPVWNEAGCDATFQLIDKLYAIAPACFIASAAGAVLTLSTGTLEAFDAANPGKQFAAPWPVQVWDVSAAIFEQRTIIAADDLTVTLDSPLGFVIEAGVDFIRVDAQTLADTTVNGFNFDGLDFVYQMPADENDAAVVEVTRWR